MKNIHKHLLTGIIWLLALLPLPVIYLLSTILSWTLLHVVKYRRKVVEENLLRSFPHKSMQERKRIMRKFYRNLSDIIFETIKMRHLSSRQLARRFTIKNPELLQPLFDAKKSFLIVTGHYGNWEWVWKGIAMAYPHQGIILTKPLKDPFFEQYMRKALRSRKAPGLIISYKKAYRHLIKHKADFLFAGILGDQTPTRGEINFWTSFLHQPTPFFLGTEKIARTLNMPVIYMITTRPARGRYEVSFEVITTQPTTTQEHEITLKYVHLLEKHIEKYPDNWLWSHKRWKHQMKEEDILIN
ncbi:MAG: lipid A biosynthesis acyltransferase [Bacteroidetes bacterium]|nr:MAG: lipid A biosynthesis acyltransferase [Bacteroidota bacterium]